MQYLKKFGILFGIGAIQFVLLNLIAYVALQVSSLGELYERNRPIPYDVDLNSYGEIKSTLFSVPTNLQEVNVRNFASPDLVDINAHLQAPIAGSVAVIVGGSSPYGIGLPNRSYFWWMLNNQHYAGLRYIDAAGIGSASAQAIEQLSRVYATSDNVALVAIYVGDNEWINFRYPKRVNSTIKAVDELMQMTSLYKILYLGYRSVLQSTLYSGWRAERDHSYLGLGDFCLKVRQKEFQADTKLYVDKVRREVLARFKGNIENMIRYAKSRKTKVILMTSPIKYRLSPCHNLAQVLSEKLTGSALESQMFDTISAGVKALQLNDLDQAERQLQMAYKLDSDSVFANHYMGYLREKRGDAEGARRYFSKAREVMIGYGGMMFSLNEAVRTIADQEMVSLVDLERIFAQKSAVIGGGLNDEFINDWCHPNPHGSMIIYEALQEKIGELFPALNS